MPARSHEQDQRGEVCRRVCQLKGTESADWHLPWPRPCPSARPRPQPDPLAGLGLVPNQSRTGASGAVQGDRPTGIVKVRPGMSSVCGGSGRRSASSSPKEATRGRRRPQGLVGGYGTAVSALEQSALAPRRQVGVQGCAGHRNRSFRCLAAACGAVLRT